MTGGDSLVRRLLSVVDLMGANLEPTSLLEQLSQSALELFGAVGACWCTLDGDEVTIVTAAGLAADLRGARFPLQGSGVGALLEQGTRSLVSPAGRYPYLNSRIYGGPDDQMAVALASVGGEPTGALYVTMLPTHPFGPDELEVLELLAGHAGMALHHVALYTAADRTRSELAAVIDAMADGIAVVGADGTVRSWNGSMARMTGRPAARVLGRPFPFPLPPAGEVLTSRPASGRWVDVVVSPAGPDGERVVSARDVTVAKELEAAQELFLAAASHELRTPLTVLRGFGDTLLRHWDVLDDVRRRELVARMLSRTDGMTALVEQILQASAAGLAASDVPVERFDLAEAVTTAAGRLAGASTEHPLVVQAPSPVPARGRPAAVAPVVDQLVENAVKYSPAGGAVEVSAVTDDACAVLRVADRGRGIPQGDHDRVFDRFYRGASGVDGPAGAGLGLWIVRRTVESQGGSVTAAPRAGGGTVVEVRLPAG